MGKVIRVFADGSANNMKQCTGGIGVYFEDKKLHNINISKKFTVDACTNNKMELMACIYAINAIIEHMKTKKQLWKLIIITDSMYVINSITQYAIKWIQYGWVKYDGGQIKNLELIKELFLLTQTYDIEYVHAKSHQKEPSNKHSKEWLLWYGNKIADELAKKCV